ncbi:MAG TPA: 1,2-phenylacetyl-CoA epoxidase subunit PaaD [Flavobacteriaceae bacterium]|nr:1,2-phenylacetyl-CoA epoxidase subunit PaaD [Flavobacteriaceae bacterium]
MITLANKVEIDKKLYPILKAVDDPEIPVSIIDLGMVREAILEGNTAKVKLTPTYSGCPATDMIQFDVKMALEQAGFDHEVSSVIDPPWTTDWITEDGRKALEDFGIAAPLDASADKKALMGEKHILKCTHCGSTHTKMISQFGSTACKAQFRCKDCGEPFDYFKCLI